MPAGGWVMPATRERLLTAELLDRLAGSDVVLLGEKHDHDEHHRWQLHTVAALHGRRGALVLAFEAFPRRSQAALDRWVANQSGVRELLAESDWNAVWGFPADLYLPLFQFARMNRVPMLALNVERSLVSRVAEEGWDRVPEGEREGLSAPAPATAEYERLLSEVYGEHARADDGAAPGLPGFIAAQLTWDRAFAEAIAQARRTRPGVTIVAVIGSGHLERGYGVPHQLAALGVEKVSVLLPWDEERDCAELAPDLADAVFGLKARSESRPRPLLGVSIAAAEQGVVVLQVGEGSVAAAAGIVAGDVLVEAAGVPLAGAADLKEIVARQAPGTWLPIEVRRAGRTIEIVARFPSQP